MYKILNSDELDAWLFEHTVNMGHKCDGVKGTLQGVQPGDATAELVNVAFIDSATDERFDIVYGDTTQPAQEKGDEL